MVAIFIGGGPNPSETIPTFCARAEQCQKKSSRPSGIFAQSIVYPTVSRKTGRVRTMIMATHTKEDLGYALEAFGQVGREMGLIDKGSRT